MLRLLVSTALYFALLGSLLFVSCASPTPAAATQTVTAYATSSAEPWMSDLFACANDLHIAVRVTADAPEIVLRVGEPEALSLPAFQIGEEELLVVTHRESPVQILSLADVQTLFSGQAETSVQVWVYPSELDLSGVFAQAVMQGRSVASGANVASTPGEMIEAINADSHAIGFIPRRWKMGDVREVYSLGAYPILAVTQAEPQGAVRALISCLQP